MRRWIIFGCGAMVLGAAWYFGKPTKLPAPAPTKAVAEVAQVEAAKEPPPRVIEVIDLARAYEPVPEREEVLPGGVDPATFIQVPEAAERIPPARDVDDAPGTEHIDVMPRVLHYGLLNFAPTAPASGELVFVPMGVPYATGITQPIPPNASIANGLLNFTPDAPVEALKVMPREVK